MKRTLFEATVFVAMNCEKGSEMYTFDMWRERTLPRTEFVLESFVKNHHLKMMAYQKGMSNMIGCVMKVWQIVQFLIAVKIIGPIEKLRQAVNIVVLY
jgi:hypothetical protein